MNVVVKVGSSTVTTAAGEVDAAVVAELCAGIAGLRRDGHQVVVVTSGAIAAGWSALGRGGPPPPPPPGGHGGGRPGGHRRP